MYKQFLSILCAGGLMIATTGCDVEQTSEGRLPDVDVDADPGAMPTYDVDTPDVDVSMKEKKVDVPDVDVDVDSEERTMSLPDVDVTLPKDE
ncbi:MAG: hypothetical protein ACF8CQ_00055 [Rhodopirellula sp. JB044]|uniref:hypothetical protein n=1 Tax=Rhodopirellula sp. JB044 TaxID=3342844 RepID=UPI00370B2035